MFTSSSRSFGSPTSSRIDNDSWRCLKAKTKLNHANTASRNQCAARRANRCALSAKRLKHFESTEKKNSVRKVDTTWLSWLQGTHLMTTLNYVFEIFNVGAWMSKVYHCNIIHTYIYIYIYLYIYKYIYTLWNVTWFHKCVACYPANPTQMQQRSRNQSSTKTHEFHRKQSTGLQQDQRRSYSVASSMCASARENLTA